MLIENSSDSLFGLLYPCLILDPTYTWRCQIIMAPGTTSPVGPLFLTNTRGGKEYSLDIIFVHGVRGHRENTWTDTNARVFWPRDLLPRDMNTARVISWGYDADVARFLSNASKVSVYGNGSSLLNDIAAERVDCEVR